MANARILLRACAELIWPSQATCIGCGDAANGAEIDWLCEKCDALLPTIEVRNFACCTRCGAALTGEICAICADWAEGAPRFGRAAYLYAPPIDRMIRTMKYESVYRLCAWMADRMTAVFSREAFGAVDALIAVPMHRRRLAERGFNHAQLLAEAVGARANHPVLTNALHRTRHTPQQARLGAQMRAENLTGAFTATDAVRGLRLLLIDDVLTTGQTALQCTRALYAAGAADVQFLTMACAAPRSFLIGEKTP